MDGEEISWWDLATLLVVEMVVNPPDSVVPLAAVDTNELVVLSSVETFEIFLRSHLLFVSKAAGCVVEVVVDAVSGVVLGLTGQTHPLVQLFPIKLLIIPPANKLKYYYNDSQGRCGMRGGERGCNFCSSEFN